MIEIFYISERIENLEELERTMLELCNISEQLQKELVKSSLDNLNLKSLSRELKEKSRELKQIEIHIVRNKHII